MKNIQLALLSSLIISTLQAKEFTITQSAPFDILTMSYKECEKNALKKIEEKAIIEYIGCSVDTSSYDIKVRHIREGEKSVDKESCNVESTVSVESTYFINNPEYLGKDGLLCGGYDSDSHSFELGLFAGVSGLHENVKLSSSSDTSILLNYSNVTLVGLHGSYMYKIFDSQYLGAKLLVAKGFETYTSSEYTNPREDGNPSLFRLGMGAFWGYKYHEKTSISLGVNYLMDSVTRNYVNNSYSANVSSVNVEATVGHFVLPYMKVWGSLASDVSANVGVSFVY